MSFPIRPVTVVHGTCLPETVRRFLPPGSIQMGEEPSDSILNGTSMTGRMHFDPSKYADFPNRLPHPHVNPSPIQSDVATKPTELLSNSHSFSSQISPMTRSISLEHIHDKLWPFEGSLTTHSKGSSYRTAPMERSATLPCMLRINTALSPEADFSRVHGHLQDYSSTATLHNGWFSSSNSIAHSNLAEFSTSHSHNTARQHHLVLPGRSEFEDELVLEVANFELTEYLICELEYLSCINSLPLDFNGSQFEEIPTNSPGAFGAKSDLKHDSPDWVDSVDLALCKQQSPRTSPLFTSDTVTIPEDIPSKLFGFSREDFFLNSYWLDKLHETDPLDAGGHHDDLSSVLADELFHTRFVTTMAADMITCCMEQHAGQTDSMAFLKQLHQLLMQTCDADWAFHGQRSPAHDRADAASPPDPLASNCSTLMPCNSVVILSSVDRAIYHADLLPLSRPLGSHDPRFCRSVPVVERLSSSERYWNDVRSPGSEVTTLTSSDHSTTTTSSPSSTSQPNYVVKNGFFTIQTNNTKRDGFLSSVSTMGQSLPFDLLINRPIPKSKRKQILAGQLNRCAGCGIFIETRYLKRMRFCEFFGKFFCCVCHKNTLMALPGNVINDWDFRMLPVSNIARDRLTQLHTQPLLRQSDFNPRLLRSQPSLHSCSALREQGHALLPFVRFCPNAASSLSGLKNLPAHWFEAPNLWSMADLCGVQDNRMEPRLFSVLQPLVDHLNRCTRCRAQGFICEICRSGHILFPFGQPNTVICPGCSACFHRACLRNPRPENCPRCLRRSRRRKQYGETHISNLQSTHPPERQSMMQI